jgi:Acetyltransferase (GNAT) domain
MTPDQLLTPYKEFNYLILNKQTNVEKLDEKLHHLYKTPFSDIEFISIFNGHIKKDNCFKLFIYKESSLKNIILFDCKKKEKTINILNNCIQLSAESIERIYRILLKEFGNIDKIYFDKILLSTNTEKKFTNGICEKISNDMIIDLPGSINAYICSLSSRTRKNLRNHQNRVQKDLPAFAISFYQKQEISFESFHKIIVLNRKRMRSMGKKSGIDDDYCKKLYKYASLYGLLSLCTNNGEIIGGAISSIIEDQAYMHVIAHENSYNKYSIGMITTIETIRCLIEKKIKQFHFLWGESEDKYRYQCKKYSLYNIRMFRGKSTYFKNKIISDLISLEKIPIEIIKRKAKKSKSMKTSYHKIKKLIS